MLCCDFWRYFQIVERGHGVLVELASRSACEMYRHDSENSTRYPILCISQICFMS
jgi:hypothetical protein